MNEHGHIPVLMSEVLETLAPRDGETYADATAGRGGHAVQVAARVGPSGLVVLNDVDPANLKYAGDRLARELGPACPRVISELGSFVELPTKLRRSGESADMILVDLGFSSSQMDDASRGLSFRADGPLDMRLDPNGPVTAAQLVNTLSEYELADIIWQFGEERHARRIARNLVAERASAPINDTIRLARIVREAVPQGRPPGERIDPATRTFQALRIAVNDELGSLQSFLRALASAAEDLAASRSAPDGQRDRFKEAEGAGNPSGGRVSGGWTSWVRTGARVAVIGFHSLEDRLVKQTFGDLARRGLVTSLTRKPITPSDQEIADNPRSRSARLRAIQLGPIPGSSPAARA